MRTFVIVNPYLASFRPNQVVTADELAMPDAKLDAFVAAGHAVEVVGDVDDTRSEVLVDTVTDHVAVVVDTVTDTDVDVDDTVVDDEVSAPSRHATRATWAAWAATNGFDVDDSMTRAEIRQLVDGTNDDDDAAAY
jgi:hypothetical protein